MPCEASLLAKSLQMLEDTSLLQQANMLALLGHLPLQHDFVALSPMAER